MESGPETRGTENSSRIKRIFLRAAGASLLSLILVSCGEVPLREGMTFPEVPLHGSDSPIRSSSQIPLPAAFIFFSNSCPECDRLLGDVEKYNWIHQLQNRFVFLLRDGFDSNSRPVSRFPTYLVNAEIWERALRIRGTPTLFLVDRTGRIVLRQLGRRLTEVRFSQWSRFFAEALSRP